MSCSYPMRWQDAKFQGLAKARNDRLCGPEKHVDKKSSDRITSDGPSPKRQTVRRTSLGAPKEPEKDNTHRFYTSYIIPPSKTPLPTSRTYVLLSAPINCSLRRDSTIHLSVALATLRAPAQRPGDLTSAVQWQFLTPTLVVAIMEANPPLLQQRTNEFFWPRPTHTEH